MNKSQLDQRLAGNLQLCAEKYPELESRYGKGIAIYKDGNVESVGRDSRETCYYTVAGPAPTGKPLVWYTVEINEETQVYTCSCPDWQMKHAPEIGETRFCKHIVAAKLEARHGQYGLLDALIETGDVPAAEGQHAF